MLGRLDVAASLEREIAHHEQAVGVGRVELEGHARVLLRVVVLVQTLVLHARKLGVKLRLGHLPLGVFELLLDQGHDTRGVSSQRIGLAQGGSGRRVAGVGLDGELVALDGAVAVAVRLEQTRRAEPVLGALLRLFGGLGERFDGRDRGAEIARLLAQPREGLERGGMARRNRKRSLEGAGGAVRRAHMVGQHAPEVHEQVDPPRVVGRRLGVGLVDFRESIPPGQSPVVPRQHRERGIVGGLEAQDLLEALGSLGVIEELLVVERRHPLVEIDLLPGRRGDRELALEVVEQLAVLAGPVEDPVETLERVDVLGVEREDHLEPPRSLVEVLEAILVDLGHTEQRLDLVASAKHLGALGQDADQRLEVAAVLGEAREPLGGLGVPGVLGQDARVNLVRLVRIAQLLFEDLGGLGAQLARVGCAARSVGVPDQRVRELGPLVHLAVHRGDALVGRLVRRVGRQHLLVGVEREVGPGELLLVPAAGVGEQVHLVDGRDLLGLDAGMNGAEHLVPEGGLALGQPLDLARHLLVRRRVAEGARVGEHRLLRIVELAREEAPDLGQDARAARSRRRRLAAREQRLDHLGVLSEGLAHVVDRHLGDLVVGIDLEDGVVRRLRLLVVARGREHPGGAVDEGLLELLGLGVVSRDADLGDLERLGDLDRIGALLHCLLERDGRVRVVGSGDEQVDERPEAIFGELLAVGANRTRGTGVAVERADRLDDRRGVGGALRGVLGEQA